MIEGLKPYAGAAKPAPMTRTSVINIPWLTAIPEHWKVVRAKGLFSARTERARPDDEQLSATQAYGVIPQKEFERRVGRKVVQITQHLDKRAHVEPDDFVISMRSFQGGLERAWARGCIRSSYVVLKPSPETQVGYFAHLFKSRDYIQALQATGNFIRDGQDLNFNNFSLVDLPLPPPDEQADIARCLDHANRKIDGFIRAKRKLIGLLNEQKQAIIHRAVTRGLHPDVPLKPSGIPWLGDIPHLWEARQVRRAAAFVTSGSRGWANFYSDDGLVFIQSGNLGRNMALNFSYTQHVRPPSGAEGERTRVHRDDLLICITGALTGNVVHVDQELPGPSFVNQHVALVRVRKATVRPRFLAFALRSEIGQGQFKTSEYGGTKQGLGLGDVKDVFFPLPSLSEQDAIIEHIDSSMAVFTTAITRTEREIALMQEYRTRLTADVVTGKLDVREAAARLPDVIDGSAEPISEEELLEESEVTEEES